MQGSHVVLKVLNCEIGFQDLEKVLDSAKMYIKYWKSMDILNSAIYLFKLCSLPLITVLQMLLHCVPLRNISKNEAKGWY